MPRVKYSIERECSWCHNKFMVYRRGRNMKFCSNKCSGLSKKGVPAKKFWTDASFDQKLERWQKYFNKHVIKVIDSCWDWNGHRNSDGYACLSAGNKKLIGAHRVSWMLHNKAEIPDDLYVLHMCDNPICTNPMHLRLGTQFDNMKDMYQKKRAKHFKPIGELNAAAKITENTARKVKVLIRQNMATKDICNLLSIARPTFYAIKYNKTWRHVS